MDSHNIIKLTDVDSTNNYALSLKGSKVFKQDLVIVSDFQTKGQGQRGNSWESEKGKNLIISLVIEPNISVKKQFDVSKIAAISVMNFLNSLGVPSKIKWPNDILVGNKKIAGILIQNVISRDIISHSVIGIGLNVNQLIFDAYTPKATSLKLEMKKKFNLEEIQKELLSSIQNRIRAYRLGKDIEAEYLDGLFQKDKVAFFESKSQKFNGIIRGVTASGLLMVETEKSIREFDLKEIKMVF
ncbi:MAG: biotin--[acetyl-CoA-carboxylase] ligase [Pelagibacterales bacterium]|nr:biotin--[acetyl-CoA-carboxylase] ligase [Pelagibacterales bacterium]